MLSRLKNYLLIGLVIAAFYFLLSHHIIVSGIKQFDLLKKNELSMEYTFVSLKQADLYDLLRNDALLDAGIEELILKRGIASQARLDLINDQVDRR